MSNEMLIVNAVNDKGALGSASKVGGGGGGGPATNGLPSGGTAGQVLKKSSSTDYDAAWGDSGAVLYNETMSLSSSEKTKARQNIKAEEADGITIVASTSYSFTPVARMIYKCGELTALTITDPPATGAYTVIFTSGSTATTTTIPATILGLETFAAEANTLYEINVLDNRAVVGSWAVS
jgi:hypothetical protein